MKIEWVDGYRMSVNADNNLPKCEDSRSPETPKEKEDAIIEAFKAFHML